MMPSLLFEENGYREYPLHPTLNGHYSIDVEMQGEIFTAIIDTGATGSVANQSLLDSLTFEVSEYDDLAAGIGGTDISAVISTDVSLNLAGQDFVLPQLLWVELDQINNVILEKGGATFDLIIGADFLKSHKAIIDYGNDLMYLKNEDEVETTGDFS